MARLAPEFSLQDQRGKLRQLSDFRGRWIVLYFYPNDHAPNCQTEACKFRDEYRIIKQFGNTEIIGINRGSVESHLRFATKYKLQFPLLSDSTHSVSKAYGAWRSGPVKWYDRGFRTRRNTYIIDPEGHIVKQYLNADPSSHVMEVIRDLQRLQARSS